MSIVFDRVDGRKQAAAEGRLRRDPRTAVSKAASEAATACEDDARLAVLRASIARGEYAVNAERVATRIILRERPLGDPGTNRQ